MKRLWEAFEVGIGLVISFLILFALCCLAGAIAMTIAKLFITSFKMIMIIGAIGYCIMVGAIIYFAFKWSKKRKQKNSQEDTRE